jgi:hypothetical protein
MACTTGTTSGARQLPTETHCASSGPTLQLATVPSEPVTQHTCAERVRGTALTLEAAKASQLGATPLSPTSSLSQLATNPAVRTADVEPRTCG